MRDRADRNRPLCDLRPQGIAEQRATKLAIEASQAAALAAAQAADAAAREVALKAVFYAALAKPALVKAPSLTRWREMDSNLRFPDRSAPVPLASNVDVVVRTRLTAGGRWIRTLSVPRD